MLAFTATTAKSMSAIGNHSKFIATLHPNGNRKHDHVTISASQSNRKCTNIKNQLQLFQEEPMCVRTKRQLAIRFASSDQRQRTSLWCQQPKTQSTDRCRKPKNGAVHRASRTCFYSQLVPFGAKGMTGGLASPFLACLPLRHPITNCRGDLLCECNVNKNVPHR